METEREKQKRWLELLKVRRDHEAMLRAQLAELDSRKTPPLPYTECHKEKLCETCPSIPSDMKMRPVFFKCDDGSTVDGDVVEKPSVSLDNDYKKYPILLKYRMEDSLARAKLDLENQQQETLRRIQQAFKHKYPKKPKKPSKVIEVKCVPRSCSLAVPDVMCAALRKTKRGKVKDDKYFLKRAVKASRCANKRVVPCCRIRYLYDPDSNCPKLPVEPTTKTDEPVEEDCTKDIYPMCRKPQEGDICKLKIPHPARFCSELTNNYELVRRYESKVNPVRVPPLNLALPCLKCIGFEDQEKIDALRRLEDEEKKTVREFYKKRHEMAADATCPKFEEPEEPKPQPIYRIDETREKPACLSRQFEYMTGKNEKCRKERDIHFRAAETEEASGEHSAEKSPVDPRRYRMRKPCFCDPDAEPVFVKAPEEPQLRYFCPSSKYGKDPEPPSHSPKRGWRCKEDTLVLPNPVKCRPPSRTEPLKLPVLRCSEYCLAKKPFDSVLEGLQKSKPRVKVVEKEIPQQPTPVHKKYDRDGCPLQPKLCPKKQKKRCKGGEESPNNAPSGAIVKRKYGIDSFQKKDTEAKPKRLVLVRKKMPRERTTILFWMSGNEVPKEIPPSPIRSPWIEEMETLRKGCQSKEPTVKPSQPPQIKIKSKSFILLRPLTRSRTFTVFKKEDGIQRPIVGEEAPKAEQALEAQSEEVQQAQVPQQTQETEVVQGPQELPATTTPSVGNLIRQIFKTKGNVELDLLMEFMKNFEAVCVFLIKQPRTVVAHYRQKLRKLKVLEKSVDGDVDCTGTCAALNVLIQSNLTMFTHLKSLRKLRSHQNCDMIHELTAFLLDSQARILKKVLNERIDKEGPDEGPVDADEQVPPAELVKAKSGPQAKAAEARNTAKVSNRKPPKLDNLRPAENSSSKGQLANANSTRPNILKKPNEIGENEMIVLKELAGILFKDDPQSDAVLKDSKETDLKTDLKADEQTDDESKDSDANADLDDVGAIKICPELTESLRCLYENIHAFKINFSDMLGSESYA